MWDRGRSIRLLIPFGALLAAVGPRLAAADNSCAPDPGAVLQCVAGQAVSGAAQGFAQSAVQAVTQWVVDTAVWLLNQLVGVIFSTSSPSLSADWFHAHYADMVAVGWVTAPIFLLLGVLQALIRADLGMFGRILAQLTLVAVLSTGAVAFAAILIGVVDQLSDFVSRNSVSDLHNFLTVVMASSFTTAAAGPNPPAESTIPLFFLFLAGVLTVLGGLLIWLELLARTLVIYAALLFFPVLLAAALWPRLSGMVQALGEVIVAVIVSKFVIVVIVAAGAAAVTATGGSNAGPSLLVGAGLLLIAAWAPWKLYRLLPALESAMIHQVGGQFQHGWTQARWRAQRATASVRRAAATTSRARLPIAGQQAVKAPAVVKTAGVAAAGAVTGGLATAAAIGAAGLKVAGSRVTGGVNMAGWQQHAVAPVYPASASGMILRPGPGVTRNPRPPAGPPPGGGAGG
jgi:hypothetical protein